MTIIFFTFYQNLYAQNTFIDSKVNFFEDQSIQKAHETINKSKKLIKNTENCPTCSSLVVKPENKYSKIDDNRNEVIKLFIDPECNYSQEAINILRKILKENRNFKGQIYLLAPLRSLIPFSQKNYDLVKEEIPIILDTEEVYKQQFEIKGTPCFIVEVKGKIYRIYGEPNNLIELLNGVL